VKLWYTLCSIAVFLHSKCVSIYCTFWSRTIHNPAASSMTGGGGDWKCFGVISSCHATIIWRRMTETPALLISIIFRSCIFLPCTFVRHFIFLSAFSSPSTFVGYIPVLHFPHPPPRHFIVRHFPVLHFQRPRSYDV